jgi:hypothetical protein
MRADVCSETDQGKIVKNIKESHLKARKIVAINNMPEPP